MNLRTLSTAVVVACALALPTTPALAAPAPTMAPFGMSSAARPGTLIQAAKKKPKAVVTATFTTLLPNNKVSVEINSNAKQVQVKYRTAKNKKRAVNKKLKRGTATVILPAGSQKILVRAKGTSKLATSPWTPAVPPAPPAPPVVPVAPPVTPAAPPVTPPVVAPPADTTPPGPVTGLAVTSVTTNTITLSWTNPTDADLATVIVNRNGGSVVYEGLAGTFTDTALNPDTTYTYQVYARDNAGNQPAAGSWTTIQATTSRMPSAIQRVNTSSSGAQAVGYNEMSGPVFSPDGTRVAFSSWSTNLVDGDTNGTEDIFVKTLATGAIERISVTGDGTQADGGSRNPQWSPDGTRIGFLSKASNLVVGADGRPQLYVKTLGSGAVQLISSNAAGEGAEIMYSDAETAWYPDLSGTRIAFASSAPNLVPGDSNGMSDIFVKNLTTGSIDRISTTATGQQAIPGGAWSPAWSPAGDRIAFVSSASNLVDSDTNDVPDVFVKDLMTGAIKRVSVSAGAGQADGGSDNPVWFPSGNTTGGRGEIAFTSKASNLVDGDTNGVSDVFVKDLLTGDIERVSTTATGAQGTGASLLSYSNPAKMWSPSGFPGQWITFISWAPNLVDGDTNGVSDIFVKNVTTGEIERINLSASGLQADGVSREPSWAPSGDRIVFGSFASNLVDGDTNGEYDIFVKTLS